MLARLREARRALGLTQAQVAAALGRPVSYVNKIELGERRIDPVDLWRLAFIYGEPVAAFLPADPPPITRPTGRPPRAPDSVTPAAGPWSRDATGDEPSSAPVAPRRPGGGR